VKKTFILTPQQKNFVTSYLQETNTRKRHVQKLISTFFQDVVGKTMQIRWMMDTLQQLLRDFFSQQIFIYQ
jgi:hypothetical protein